MMRAFLFLGFGCTIPLKKIILLDSSSIKMSVKWQQMYGNYTDSGHSNKQESNYSNTDRMDVEV